jgi:hypothetical protein
MAPREAGIETNRPQAAIRNGWNLELSNSFVDKDDHGLWFG